MNNYSWITSRRRIDLSERVLIMGVLNVTPDSFSDGGRWLSPDSAIERAREMVDEGAEIIDLGAESTRPGAVPVTGTEEIDRLSPVLEGLGSSFPVPLSVDTSKAAVAARVLDSGVEIINDVSGLKRDPEMAGVIARHGAGVVVMHMRGDPRTMQDRTAYRDLVGEVRAELEESAGIGLRAGITPEQMVFDPGIGFAKEWSQSCALINRLEELRIMGRPLLVGPSRKSFIGRILNLPLDERLEGTIAAGVLSMLRGAGILRVHDVREVRRAVDVAAAIMAEAHDPA